MSIVIVQTVLVAIAFLGGLINEAPAPRMERVDKNFYLFLDGLGALASAVYVVGAQISSTQVTPWVIGSFSGFICLVLTLGGAVAGGWFSHRVNDRRAIRSDGSS